jgi:sugar phosphate isomerase/epimerase
MSFSLDRRQLLAATGAALSTALVTRRSDAADPETDKRPFGYCLNMSTIRGQELSLPEQVDVAAKAGYDAIEPWIREIRKYVDDGGSLGDLKKQIDDAGLTVESAIGFATWIVDDDKQRAKGYETAKQDMDLLQQIGGTRIAAPPTGATKQTDLNLFAAAERYRKLLEIGDEIGVTPELELWGFSKSVSRLGELMFIAVESGHPAACVLPDVYHIYKGGSDFAGLRLIEGKRIPVFHMNDYPDDPPRATIGDADRVYPGDGVAPLDEILRTLQENGSRCMLSLELFNRGYWKQDAAAVARTGLAKMRSSVASALG